MSRKRSNLMLVVLAIVGCMFLACEKRTTRSNPPEPPEEGNWTTYKTSNSGLAGNYVKAIAIDASGNKWFGTVGGGVSRFDGTNWTTYNTSNSGLPDNNIHAIAIDASGNKWFGTGKGGVSEFDGTSWTTYDTSNSGLPANGVWAIAIDAFGNKWFGSVSCYGSYSPLCWGGISKFDGTNWTTYDTSNSGLHSIHVQAIAIDASGNKWFGSIKLGLPPYIVEGGVSKFDGTNWTTYDTSNSGLAGNDVRAIAIDASGNKWFGGSYVSKFDDINWITYNTSNSGLASNNIWAIAIDTSGNKWFGGGLGVSKFDGTNWTTYNTSNSGLAYNLVLTIAIDASGNKWFGTSKGGVSKFHE